MPQAREEALVETAARPVKSPAAAGRQFPAALRELALARLRRLAQKSHHAPPATAAAAAAAARPAARPAPHPAVRPAAAVVARPAAAVPPHPEAPALATAPGHAKALALARIHRRAAAAAPAAGEEAAGEGDAAPLADNTEAEAAAATAMTLAKVRGAREGRAVRCRREAACGWVAWGGGFRRLCRPPSEAAGAGRGGRGA